MQKKGGPIGLRSTCHLAHLVILIRKSNLTLVGSVRYMDDVRFWLHVIRPGWRWMVGKLIYKHSWRLEAQGAAMSRLDKTTQILGGI